MTISLGDAAASSPIVLLVDDDPDTCEMYSVFFETSGLRVATADTADEAVRTVQEVHPNVVVTDYALGGRITGADLVHTIRSNTATDYVPIIVLSGRAFDDLPTAMRQEADLLLLKPVAPDLLLGCVRDVLERTLHSRNGGEAAGAPVQEVAEPAGAHPAPSA